MNDPRYATLLGWIRAKPSIAGIRIDGDDSKVVRIAGRQYTTAERAVLALEPTKLEGLDADGSILRTFTVKDAIAKVESAARMTEQHWPAGEVSELGQVIALACDRAVSRVENIFREMLQSVTAMNREQSARMAQLEALRFAELEARMAEIDREREEAIADAEDARVQLAESQQGATGADAALAQLAGAVVTKSLASPNGKAQ